MQRFLTYLPTLCLGLVFIIDAIFARRGGIRLEFAIIRELLLVVGFLILIPVLQTVKWVSEQKILTKLRTLFYGFIALLLFSIVANLLFLAGIEEVEPKTLYSYFPAYLYSVLVSIMASIFSVIILLNLRDLIYARRRKYTSRNFYLMLIVMAVQILYTNVISLYFHDLRTSRIGGGIPHFSILFILIIFLVINSFRNSWINFLNKKQKLVCFWASMFLIPVAIYLTVKFQKQELIYAFSPSLGGFLEVTTLFFSIYVIMAFFGLLFHLPTAGLYDRKLQEVASLHELSRIVSSVLDTKELVKTITRLACSGSHSDYSWLLLLDDNGKELRSVSGNGIGPQFQDRTMLSLNEAWIQVLISEKKGLLSNEVYHDDALKDYLHKIASIGSVLAVPLVFSNKVKGILFAAKQEGFGFEQDDQMMLQAFANQAATALQNAHLIEEVVQKELFEQELKIAHDAQMQLLPKKMPQIAELEIQATCITANEVGGDYYDFFDLGPDKLGIAIGDVSGKGPSAAFYMAQIKGIMSSFAQTIQSPRELLIKANQVLYNHIERKVFISMNYAVIDVRLHHVTFARAGHCPPLYLKQNDDCWRYLEPGGLGLGMDPGSIFDESLQEQQFQLDKGDVLFFYTDGVTEARNLNSEEFQEERLGKNLMELRTLSAVEIKCRFVERLREFVGDARPHDDLTFIVLKVIG